LGLPWSRLLDLTKGVNKFSLNLQTKSLPSLSSIPANLIRLSSERT
jgi:hypothetical protein